jgi:hypothetical protein
MAGFRRPFRGALKRDFYIVSDKRASGCKDAIQQINMAVAFKLGNRLANSQADHIAMPDQVLISRVGQHEPMFRTLKERRETRRLSEHLPERRTCAPASGNSPA